MWLSGGCYDVYAGVHFDTGVQHARQDTHAGMCLPTLRQTVLAAVAAAGSCPDTHRWTSVPLSTVLQDVRWQVQPSSTRPDPLSAQAVLVREVWQGVRAQELPVQARRVIMYASWSWSHDYRKPTETTAACPCRPTECYCRLHRLSVEPPAESSRFYVDRRDPRAIWSRSLYSTELKRRHPVDLGHARLVRIGLFWLRDQC